MQTKSYEEMNLDLQKKLNKENEIYYSNFLIYMRTHTFTKNNEKVEVLLLDILQNILQAQSEGISAESYFGKNPKVIADELIKELPNSFFDTLKLLLVALVAFCVAIFFPSLLSPDKSIDLGSFLISAVIAVLFSFIALKIIGNSAYNNHKKRNEFVFIGFVALLFCVIVAVLVLISTPLTISIGNTTGVWLILIVFCLLTYLFVQERDKKMWIPFVPVVIGYSVCGILIRMNYFSDYFTSNSGKTALAIISAAIWGIFCILMIMSQKKAKQ